MKNFPFKGRSNVVVAIAVCGALWQHCAQADPVPCHGNIDTSQITAALARMDRSVDPCGESGQVQAILEQFKHCMRTAYEICTDHETLRNYFDRATEQQGVPLSRITWNPELRSELERGCDGDPDRPVARDPTASLLHEIVHAVQDCRGENPGELEREAVRIENIYRRAAGLCQRTRYGDEPLPPALVKTCAPGSCSCAAPPASWPVPDAAKERRSPAAAPSLRSADLP